mmetsp:Transcript_15173/g.62167  ORF Transcript_15173/g.62167 Transcript_15173/m.62167 type:complete len:904 (-) Transcript_15173:902-3613(-)
MKFLLVSTLLVLIAIARSATPNCRASVKSVHSFPDTPYVTFNPHLTNDPDYLALVDQLVDGTCDPNRDPGQVCAVTPAFGSGLSILKNKLLIGLTDRGPNQDCEALCELDPVKYSEACGKSGKGFPVPKFAPTIAKFKIRPDGIKVKEYIMLKDLKGSPLSGISNTELDDTPYGPNCSGKPLPYDPNGVDPEDIHQIPKSGGLFALVEEYSPSILLMKKDGTVFARYVPKSIASMLKKADMKVYGEIPDVFKNRRKNRGFEGLVVSKDGSYLIAILQSPMGDRNIPEYDQNRVIRAVVFEIKLTGKPDEPAKLKFKKTFAFEGSPVSTYFTSAVVPADLKYSAAQYYDDHSFIALERASGQVKWFNINWEMATDLSETKYANNLKLEFESAGTKSLEDLGVMPAMKTKVLDTYASAMGGTDNFEGSAKQEGFATKGSKFLYSSQDNDFGLENNPEVMISFFELGRNLGGPTVCSRPEAPKPPNKKTEGGLKFVFKDQIVLSKKFDEAKVEIIALDENSNTLYSANAADGRIDAYRRKPLKKKPLVSFSAGDDTGINSVDVCNYIGDTSGFIAAAVEDKTGGPGFLLILKPKFENGKLEGLKKYRKFKPDNCFLPDAVHWSPDCSYVSIACEGEGADVPGGVLVWNALTDSVKVATFDAFDEKKLRSELKKQGVRLWQNPSMPSMVLEPEYITYTMDSQYAIVGLQENNAFAVVDLAEAKVTEIKPLIFTPRYVKGYGIDASDDDGEINIRRYPKVYGMCQPDTIQLFESGGVEYIAVACEGDAWGEEYDEIRAGDIESDLGRNLAPELKGLIRDDKKLGRLEVSYPDGYNKETNTQEALFHFGARSFQIYKLDGTCVVDSGDGVKKLIAILSTHFTRVRTRTPWRMSLTPDPTRRGQSQSRSM